MKAKIEYTDGSVKVIKVEHILVDINPVFNELYYQFNNFENKGKCEIEEISRVTVEKEKYLYVNSKLFLKLSLLLVIKVATI